MKDDKYMERCTMLMIKWYNILICQFFPSWSIDSTQSKQAFFPLEIDRHILKCVYKCKRSTIIKRTL